MLKKQTIWLLTMVSLVVVLSVYYIATPELQTTNFSLIQKGDEVSGSEEGTEVSSEQGAEGEQSLDAFTDLRMQLEDTRAKAKEELEAVVASGSVSAEEKSQALDDMAKMNETSEKEAVLETMLKTEENIYDAFVHTTDQQIKVTVAAKESTPALADQIIQRAYRELGQHPISVEIKEMNA